MRRVIFCTCVVVLSVMNIFSANAQISFEEDSLKIAQQDQCNCFTPRVVVLRIVQVYSEEDSLKTGQQAQHYKFVIPSVSVYQDARVEIGLEVLSSWKAYKKEPSSYLFYGLAMNASWKKDNFRLGMSLSIGNQFKAVALYSVLSLQLRKNGKVITEQYQDDDVAMITKTYKENAKLRPTLGLGVRCKFAALEGGYDAHTKGAYGKLSLVYAFELN